MNNFTPTPARPLQGAGARESQFFAHNVGKKLQKKSSPPPWGGGREVGTIATKNRHTVKTVRVHNPHIWGLCTTQTYFSDSRKNAQYNPEEA